MSQMPQLRDILNDTPATAVDVDYNFGALETHVAQELVNRDGTVAMTGALTLAGPAPSQPAHAVPKSYVDAQVVPTGVIWQFGGAAAPAGWAVCDGGEKSSTDPLYTALFAVIGYTYGRGAGNNFLMPDMRGRVVAGVNAADAGLFALGKAGGSKDATLPSHTHVANSHVHNRGGHGHSIVDHGHGMYHEHAQTTRKGFDIHSGNQAGETNAVFKPGMTTPLTMITRPSTAQVADVGGGGDQTTGGRATTDIAALWTTSDGNGATEGPSNQGMSTVGSAPTNANLPPYVTVNYIIKL
jgi:microcystin-dependent protein